MNRNTFLEKQAKGVEGITENISKETYKQLIPNKQFLYALEVIWGNENKYIRPFEVKRTRES